VPLDDDVDARSENAPEGLDLGGLLRSDDSRTNGRLDADAVIRRSRRRRGTKIAGFTTAWVLAGTLVIGGGAVGIRQLLSTTGSSGSSSSVAGGAAPDAAPPTREAADPACGSPAPATTVPADGLSASVTIAGTATPGSTVTATVTLTNTGTAAVAGAAEQPRGVLVRAGVVTWRSTVVPTISPRTIDLAPGESTSFPVAIVSDQCAVGDDNATDLPVAPVGTYRVFASIVVHLPAGDEVIASQPAQLRVR
jgi:hypothetical protein